VAFCEKILTQGRMVVYAPPAHVTCDMEHIGTKRFVCDSRISKKSLAESGHLVIPSRLNLSTARHR
jgi:hypothetical protein